MAESRDIFDLVQAESQEAQKRARRAVILQPGALGDCILTLPLAKFIKDRLDLGSIDILGHTDYIGFFPGRTCIDGIKSIDSIDMHPLFEHPETFTVTNRNTLLGFFAEYIWIISFLGEPDSHFEQNLIFTANCSHSAEVVSLHLKAPDDYDDHIITWYIRQFAKIANLDVPDTANLLRNRSIRINKSDFLHGMDMLDDLNVDFSNNVVVLAPGSGSPEKNWHCENYLALADQLLDKGDEIVFLLGPVESERMAPKQIDRFAEKGKVVQHVPINYVCGLLSCADAYVGNDSGTSHLAGALAVKTIALFGPTCSRRYRPLGPNVTVIESDNPDFAKAPAPRLQDHIMEILS